ncbi:MAG: peptidoglycan-binding protein [Clostridia bacterium]|nr:peptidoglycan-binding protein [Clostridia bacterium]
MKRNGKAAGLILTVGLCFVLTGCYIAPDDVNNDGGAPTGNSLPFNTLAPTATVEVTPDTVVVETQNVFGGGGSPQGGNQPQATPTPASGTVGWNDWGSVEQKTPIPSSGTFEVITPTPDPRETIAVVTAKPTNTPIALTPSPTPASLQQGFKGSDEVRALQKRLKALGYYSGAADGDFGPATERAVRAFQKANGLTVDGKAGAKTLEKLNSKNAISAKQANATATPKATARPTARPTPRATPTPRPTATPNLSRDYYLTLGSRGNKVTTLQRRLIELGWLSGKVTGEYDAATQAAVTAFQAKTKGLWEDGIAGPDTLRAIYSSGAARTAHAVSGSGETLQNGSEGAAVRQLQQQLKDLGYLSGSVDGSFGVATEAAVIAFQKNNNLTADGKAGTATLSKLYSGTAVRASGKAVRISGTAEKLGGADTSDISSTGYATLSDGSEGEQVRRLQQRLKDLGYYTGSVDGRYGSGTQAAVMAFQLRNSLTVDGKAGPATQRLLYGSSASITYSAMQMGDDGTAVRNLQYTLYELGYYDGSIDGVYGQTTSDAVRAFQIQNRLKVDGKAGTETLKKLYSRDARSATAAQTSYESVRPGARGNEVVEIQECLEQMGFLDEVNGEYDAKTEAAVRAFQKANGLTADGIAGNQTLMVLFGY